MSPQILKLSALSGLAAALGGCATYGPPSRNIAYFAVPCNTPGAFVAQPLSAPDAPPATPGPGGPGGPAAQNVQACMIAVPAQNLAYNARYRGAGAITIPIMAIPAMGRPSMVRLGSASDFTAVVMDTVAALAIAAASVMVGAAVMAATDAPICSSLFVREA